MGSGDRFKLHLLPKWNFYIGFGFDTFPFKYTFSVTLIFFMIEIGLGKAYDDIG